MLKTIDGVSRAAVLDGYSSKSVQLPDFVRYNLIYGWNASGKTTLSRVVGLLCAGGPSRLPEGAYARFGREGGGQLDTRNKDDQNRVHVRVFNRDFIEDNLSDQHTSAPALFIVGSDNIRLTNRITQLNGRRERVAEVYRTAKKSHGDASKIREKLATDLASACGTALGIRAFRSPDLKGIASSIEGREQDYLLDETTLQTAISSARSQEQFRLLSNPLRLPSRLPEAADFVDLLRKTPKQTALKRLAESRDLSDWVRYGLRFHEHGTNCAFCGNDASNALEEYARHFSDEYQRQHAAITSAINDLERPEGLPSVPHEREWVPAVRERLKLVTEAMLRWYESEREIRQAWRDQLKQKLESMEAEVELLKVADDRLKDLVAMGAQLGALVTEHNDACNAIGAVQKKAADQVKHHYAARYMLDPEAAAQMESLGKAEAHMARVEKVGRRIRDALENAQQELQKSSVAANEVNALLQKILGTRVSVEQAEDGKLRFMRSGQLATNLSDGERTAVSLAYFLVSLKQNGQSLSDTIVFIDDPICSLDANHIFDVAYLLLKQCAECKQLFLSTHNSEFFNAVKQEWAGGPKFKKDHAGYLMHRHSETRSELVALPAHLTKFRSDYHYVFHCLSKIRSSTSQDTDSYMHCPNLIRRFLEMYLAFAFPLPVASNRSYTFSLMTRKQEQR